MKLKNVEVGMRVVIKRGTLIDALPVGETVTVVEKEGPGYAGSLDVRVQTSCGRHVWRNHKDIKRVKEVTQEPREEQDSAAQPEPAHEGAGIEPVPPFKVGDICRATSGIAHCFSQGEIVRVVAVDGLPHCESARGRDQWVPPRQLTTLSPDEVWELVKASAKAEVPKDTPPQKDYGSVTPDEVKVGDVFSLREPVMEYPKGTLVECKQTDCTDGVHLYRFANGTSAAWISVEALDQVTWPWPPGTLVKAAPTGYFAGRLASDGLPPDSLLILGSDGSCSPPVYLAGHPDEPYSYVYGPALVKLA